MSFNENQTVNWSISSSVNEQYFSSNNRTAYFASAGPPEPLLADRLQLATLILLFVVGAPVNLAAFSKLHRQRSIVRNGRLALLKFHLNISDLMVLFIYVTTTLCWQVTFQWRGGDVLCRLLKYLNSTAFQVSSNLIVAVALDRFLTVLNGTSRWYKRHFKRKPVFYVRLCVLICWTSALLLNLPQLYTWRTYAPFPAKPEWRQCVTIYSQRAHQLRLLLANVTDNSGDSLSTILSWRPLVSQLQYDVTFVVFVFWAPALTIILFYACVLAYLHHLHIQRRRRRESTLTTYTLADERRGIGIAQQDEVADQYRGGRNRKSIISLNPNIASKNRVGKKTCRRFYSFFRRIIINPCYAFLLTNKKCRRRKNKDYCQKTKTTAEMGAEQNLQENREQKPVDEEKDEKRQQNYKRRRTVTLSSMK